jgi:hypothetical protein
MLQKRKFNIILAKQNHGAGIEPSPEPNQVVEYSGSETSVVVK